MKYYYIDSGPLVCCVDVRVPTPKAYDVKVASVVTELVEGSDTTAISETTILEVHSVICDHWRDTNMPEHDATWAEGAFGQIMAWLERGDLEVLTSPPKLAEMAMANVEEVTRSAGVQLRAWDAAHLVHAGNWSRTLGEKVTLVSADSAFRRVLDTTEAFQPLIELLDPGA